MIRKLTINKYTFKLSMALCFGLFFNLSTNTFAQNRSGQELSIGLNRELPADTSISKTRSVNIKGKDIPYEVTVGTQPVYGEDGKPDAALFYTYYRRTDVKDTENEVIISSTTKNDFINERENVENSLVPLPAQVVVTKKTPIMVYEDEST